MSQSHVKCNSRGPYREPQPWRPGRRGGSCGAGRRAKLPDVRHDQAHAQDHPMRRRAAASASGCDEAPVTVMMLIPSLVIPSLSRSACCQCYTAQASAHPASMPMGRGVLSLQRTTSTPRHLPASGQPRECSTRHLAAVRQRQAGCKGARDAPERDGAVDEPLLEAEALLGLLQHERAAARRGDAQQRPLEVLFQLPLPADRPGLPYACGCLT